MTVLNSQYRERNSTADRALEILNLFEKDRLTLSGSYVAEALGTARSTAYRYLQSLVRSGFLEEDPRSGFRLGTRILELASLARRGYGLPEIALPVMTELAQELNETVLLTKWAGSTVVCLERAEAEHPVRISYERGSVLPINAGASALVLLAYAPLGEASAILNDAQLEKLTPRTMTDPDEILARLEDIRAAGHALSEGELDEDIVGIAAPIKVEGQRVDFALSIAGLRRRLPDERLPAVVERVVRTAEALSERYTLLQTS